jgi:hypothetical protein
MTTVRDINNYDRVTSILYPFSGLSRIDPLVLKNAANRGTIIHNMCDCIISDLPMDEIAPDHQGYIDSFKLWSEGKTFLPKPERFFDDELMITGECDGLYEEDGEITLFDLKTPLREGSTWGMQGSAYAYLAKLNGLKIDKVEFIRLKKDGGYPSIYGYPDLMKDFLMCLEVYQRYFKNNNPDLRDF